MHDVYVPIHTRTSDAIVARSPNHSAYGGAVTAGRDVIGVITCIPTIEIVYITVVVIVHAVAWNLRCIRPMVVDEVNMVVIRSSTFQDSNDNARAIGRDASGRHIPSQIGVNIVVTILIVVPLLAIIGVVGNGFALVHDVIQLHGSHVTLASEQ